MECHHHHDCTFCYDRIRDKIFCSPMAIIVKNDFGASNVLAQIGNYGNFIAYLVMGIPAGMLIAKYGYKKRLLSA